MIETSPPILPTIPEIRADFPLVLRLHSNEKNVRKQKAKNFSAAAFWRPSMMVRLSWRPLKVSRLRHNPRSRPNIRLSPLASGPPSQPHTSCNSPAYDASCRCRRRRPTAAASLLQSNVPPWASIMILRRNVIRFVFYTPINI